MSDRELMQQALEAMDSACHGYVTGGLPKVQQAIAAFRAAIEQAQEPVAWVVPSWLNSDTRLWESQSFSSRPIKGWLPLYTATLQWQGLTDEEREQFRQWAHPDIIEAIELKLQERNT